MMQEFNGQFNDQDPDRRARGRETLAQFRPLITAEESSSTNRLVDALMTKSDPGDLPEFLAQTVHDYGEDAVCEICDLFDKTSRRSPPMAKNLLTGFKDKLAGAPETLKPARFRGLAATPVLASAAGPTRLDDMLAGMEDLVETNGGRNPLPVVRPVYETGASPKATRDQMSKPGSVRSKERIVPNSRPTAGKGNSASSAETTPPNETFDDFTTEESRADGKQFAAGVSSDEKAKPARNASTQLQELIKDPDLDFSSKSELRRVHAQLEAYRLANKAIPHGLIETASKILAGSAVLMFKNDAKSRKGLESALAESSDASRLSPAKFEFWKIGVRAALPQAESRRAIEFVNRIRHGEIKPTEIPAAAKHLLARAGSGKIIDHPWLNAAVDLQSYGARSFSVDEATRNSAAYKVLKSLGPTGIELLAMWIGGPVGVLAKVSVTAAGLLESGGAEALAALKKGAPSEAAARDGILAMIGGGAAKGASTTAEKGGKQVVAALAIKKRVDWLIKAVNLVTRGAGAPVIAAATQIIKRGGAPATVAALETVVDNILARVTGLDPDREVHKGMKSGTLKAVRKGAFSP